jgi:hypothetical protein
VDIIGTKDGSLYKGTIVAQDSAAIAIELEGGSVIRIPMSNVLNTRYNVWEPEKKRDKEREKGWHRHDGFFLSMNMGGGQAFDKWDRSSDDGSGTAIVSGPTLDFIDIRIGGAVKENLILSFDVLGSGIMVPRASGKGLNVNGLGVPSPPDTVYGEVAAGAGLGVTYYFMPHNVFLSGTLGFGTLSMIHKYGTQSDSSIGSRESWRFSDADGVMLRIKVGKEWWVSKNWGLGVSGSYTIFQGKETKGDADDPSFAVDPSYKGSLTSQRVAISFNTTFN